MALRKPSKSIEEQKKLSFSERRAKTRKLRNKANKVKDSIRKRMEIKPPKNKKKDIRKLLK